MTSLALAAWIRAMKGTQAAAGAGVTLPGLLPGLAAAHGDRVALFGDGGTLSYRGLAERASAVGGWVAAQGLAGETIGLLLPNCADYVAIWLGLSGAGCAVALLNTHLPGEASLHGIAVSGASALIVGRALLPGVLAVAGRLPAGMRVWVHGGDGVLWPAFEPGGAVVAAGDAAGAGERALLIFTSGTTGLPKAAVISHARIVEWSYWFAGLTGAGAEDRVYDCLPLYHSVGGIIAVGSMLVVGGSVLIRERFSASRFWEDVAGNGCTIFQYVGELCRYLLRAAPRGAEREHRLRLACGNGLGADIWEAVQERFGLPQILEFYAATEGGVSLYNVEGRPGAIGRVPGFLADRVGVRLVRIDAETGEMVRDGGGRCVACADGEAGEALGQLGVGRRRFDGYTDGGAGAAKVLTDVFADGDAWFRTGDLMRRDGAGYFYFVDRMGDGYRWKGENVSAAEVRAAVLGCPGVVEAAVYGVRVPGHDGRAGMAALTVDGGFGWGGLLDHLAGALPGYAWPVFVRVCAALAVTGTFKLAKAGLVRDGWAGGGDPVWVHEAARGGFVRLDAGLATRIEAGGWRG